MQSVNMRRDTLQLAVLCPLPFLPYLPQVIKSGGQNGILLTHNLKLSLKLGDPVDL